MRVTEKPAKPTQPHGCGGTKFWLPQAEFYLGPLNWICSTCHPPYGTQAEEFDLAAEIVPVSSTGQAFNPSFINGETGKPAVALSIKQPWAWLICAGYKDIENRDWGIGKDKNPMFTIPLPSRVYVHTGKSQDELTKETIAFVLRRLDNKQAANFMLHCQIQAGVPPLFAFDSVIGEVTITACVKESASPWFVGEFGFKLENPTLYKVPITYPGKLGFFEVSLGGVRS